MSSHPVYLVAVFCAIVAVAEWLGRTRVGRTLGGAIIALLLGALCANVGLLPSPASPPALYAHALSVAVPLAVFLLLLDCRVLTLRQLGAGMSVAFGLGAIGTMAGVVGAFWITDIRVPLGEVAEPVAGMIAATYVGGSPNLMALALHFDVITNASLMAAVGFADVAAGVAWLVLLVPLARWLGNVAVRRGPTVARSLPGDESWPACRIGPADLLAVAALSLCAMGLTDLATSWLAARGVAVPKVLVVTVLGLVAAQFPRVHTLTSARPVGVFLACLVVAMIGAMWNVTAVGELGQYATPLLLFVAVVLAVHGLVVFGVGRALGLDPSMLAIASSANVGGVVTILPVARGLGRMDLMGPGLLAGSLGNGMGTFAGFLAVQLLRG